LTIGNKYLFLALIVGLSIVVVLDIFQNQEISLLGKQIADLTSKLDGYGKSENLSIVGIWLEPSYPTFPYYLITIRNSGNVDAKLEYIVVNGTLSKPYDYIIIPYGCQANYFFTLSTDAFKPNSTAEVRLHTVSGYDFSQNITVPSR